MGKQQTNNVQALTFEPVIISRYLNSFLTNESSDLKS